jgi:prolipoprotein diacylglyceryltransferase
VGIVYRHPRSRVVRLSTLAGVPIHPTPLYSMLWNIVIAVILTRLWFGGSPLSLIGGLYLILTGVGRFVEEAYRGEPQTRITLGLRFYQWIAIVTVVAGAIVTSVGSLPAPFPLLPPIEVFVAAAAFGLVTWGALGLDFPGSNRRFARLG